MSGGCCDIGQNDTISRNRINSLFHLGFKRSELPQWHSVVSPAVWEVQCVTNWHYKVLGVKQTSIWHFTHLRSQYDSLPLNCNSVYELCVKYCPRDISPYSLQYIWELSHVFSCLFRHFYINQCKFHSIISFSNMYPLVQHVLPCSTDSTTYE